MQLVTARLQATSNVVPDIVPLDISSFPITAVEANPFLSDLEHTVSASDYTAAERNRAEELIHQIAVLVSPVLRYPPC